MTRFGRSDDLQGAEFVGADLSGAQFRECDLSGIVMRGVELARADLDAPWLPFGGFLKINGVDVLPFVEAELDRLFPGRGQRTAADPASLRAAWVALEQAWDATLDRVAAMPDGTVDVQVAGEWSFAQTLRHLVLATDLWFGSAVLRLEDPFHPLGLRERHSGGEVAQTEAAPAYAEVLEARADRQRQVRDFIGATTPEQLAEERANPHAPEHAETVLSCLHTILEEEWEHLRFAQRDLDALESDAAGSSS